MDADAICEERLVVVIDEAVLDRPVKMVEWPRLRGFSRNARFRWDLSLSVRWVAAVERLSTRLSHPQCLFGDIAIMSGCQVFELQADLPQG